MATTSSTWLKLKEVLDELHISRTTFDLWKTDGRAPRCYKLPNGQYRIRRIAELRQNNMISDLEHEKLKSEILSSF